MVSQNYIYSISRWVSGNTSAGFMVGVTKHLTKAMQEGLFWLTKGTLDHSRKDNMGGVGGAYPVSNQEAESNSCCSSGLSPFIQ